MSRMDSEPVYYPVSWMKTVVDGLWNLFIVHPRKTKRSLPEEAECGTLDGVKSWLREGSFEHREKSKLS